MVRGKEKHLEVSHKALEEWGGWGDGGALESLCGRLAEPPGNAITFISLRMDDELLVSTAPYNCNWSRTMVRCFIDTILSATAMPCNKDYLNPTPQLRARQAGL